MSKETQELLQWFKDNKFENISDTGLTWREVGEMFGITSEQARYSWRKSKKKTDNLVLKSRWQVQKKGGAVEWLESYYNPDDRLSEFDIESVIQNIKITPFFEKQNNPFKAYLKESYKPSLILYIADQHIGAANESNGLYSNPYDKDEVKRRLEKIAKHLQVLAKNQSFEDLIICFLGDSIDSYNNLTSRGGHQLPSNMTNKEMFDCFVDTHSNFLSTLIQNVTAKRVTIYGTANSNHPGDIEYMAMQALKYFCQAHNMPLTFHIIEKFLDYFIIENNAFILTHGKDKQHLKFGLPKNVDTKTELYIEQFINYNKLHDYKVHLIKGDLHVQNSEEGKFFRYRNVGSLYGASDWIMHNYGRTNPCADYDLMIPGIGILEGKINLGNDDY
jgi:hypothetical protein